MTGETDALLRSLRDSVGQVGQLASVVTSRVTRVERSEQDRDQYNSRMDRMEQKLSRLAGLVEGQARSSPTSTGDRQADAPRRFPPPHAASSSDPWARYSSATTASVNHSPAHETVASPSRNTGNDDDTDYCHIVFGGWGRDTRRAVIEGDMRNLLASMGLDQSQLEVKGLRSTTAHYQLPELGLRESKQRFYGLQQRWNKSHKTSKGVDIWMAPARSDDRRQRNRVTRDGVTRLQHALGDELSNALEIEWGRQLVWLGDRRTHGIIRASPVRRKL